MDCNSLMFVFSLIYFPCLISAQQPYLSNICPPPSSDNISSVSGYACNGVNNTCPAYLLYRTQPSYDTLASIASLFYVNASDVSSINNNLAVNARFPANTEVLIPVTCTCFGRFYKSDTSYLIRAGDTYYALANDTFEGLTTCNAIQLRLNIPFGGINLFVDQMVIIPIRCACPTRKQVGEGIRYLMSYVIQSGDTISNIANKFGASLRQTLEANEKSEQDSVIIPFTTLLVPFKTPPNGSLLEYPPPISHSASPSPSSTTPPSAPSPGGSSNKKWVYLGVGVGAFLLVLGIIMLFIWLTGRKKTDPSPSSQSFEPALEHQKLLKRISSIASLKVYGFEDLQAATENFNSKYGIGDDVFKGILSGNQVAIRKMHGDVRKEVNLLNKINHFNLVSLLGVCFEPHDAVWYLIYEYTVNGPLTDWIFQKKPNQKTLLWGNRIQVALDVAMGLNYLHSYTSLPHVHKNINSSNVLLDCDFRAKISNFELSRPLKLNSDQYSVTKHIVGTKGYLAPEYLENGLISPMLDVYSFGVLLLEMLTGKDVGCLYQEVKVYLSEVLAPLLREANGSLNLKTFLDPSLGEDYPAKVAMSMVVLVDLCLRKDPGSRPTMEDIVRIMSKISTAYLNL